MPANEGERTDLRRQPPRWVGYAVVVVSEIVLTAGLAFLNPFFPLASFPIPYVVLTMAVAYLFGEGPAVASIILGWFAVTYFLIPPRTIHWPPAHSLYDWARQLALLLGFIAVGIATIQARRSNRRIRLLADEATSLNARLKEEMAECEEAAEALRESRQDLNRAQAVAQTGSWRMDVRRDELLWSDETYRIFGIPRGTALTYEAFLATVRPEDRDYVDEKWNAALRGEPYDIEHPIVVGDNVRWVSERAELEFDGEGQLLGGFGTVQDITERKQAEEELARSHGELEEALDRERHYSLLLQRALLPSAPRLGPGYSVAAEYVPAYEVREIGGDFYDVFQIGEHTDGVVIGDVAGKGLEAAAMAAITRSTIHAFVHETPSPAEALRRTNSVLHSRQMEFESFVTVFLVIIDARSGRITYSSAGHPPALILHLDGRVETLELGKLPLALEDDEDYTDYHAELRRGDRLILYTDGVSEARNGPLLLESEGIERILTEHAGLSIDELAKALIAAATEWAGGKLQDDAAVVVAERHR